MKNLDQIGSAENSRTEPTHRVQCWGRRGATMAATSDGIGTEAGQDHQGG